MRPTIVHLKTCARRLAPGLGLLLCLAWPAMGAGLEVKTSQPALAAHVRQMLALYQPRLQRLSGVTIDNLTIEIPPDQAAFNARLAQINAPNWAAAVATGNLIIIRPPRLLHGEQNFNQTLLHELTHIYMGKALDNAPWWLQEGLAMLAENAGPGRAMNQPMIPWRAMDESFFPQAQQVQLAYAQAYAMAAFFERHQLLPAIIQGMAQGHNFERSLYLASGQGINYWQKLFEQQKPPTWLALDMDSVLWSVLGLAAAVIVVWRRKKMLRHMKQMPIPAIYSQLRPVRRPKRYKREPLAARLITRVKAKP